MPAFRIFRRLRDLLDVDFTGVSNGDAVVYDEATDTFVAGPPLVPRPSFVSFDDPALL